MNKMNKMRKIIKNTIKKYCIAQILKGIKKLPIKVKNIIINNR